MKKNISSAMQRAINVLKEGGTITRPRPVFWSRSTPQPSLWLANGDYEGQMSYNTLSALIDRGFLIEYNFNESCIGWSLHTSAYDAAD